MAGLMRRLRPSDDPDRDAKVLGPFAMLLVHGMVAKGERASRQQALAAPAIVRERGRAARGPVIIVQCESFFDARRVSPLVPADLLPAFDACCREGAMFGRLEVPGWGANTMRTEFAVLSGIPERDLGYDRFNPYFALARVPIASQVWRLRRQGYRTVCLHPFDRRFFRRDLAMPALGFEKFLGRETLGGSRVPPYCPDPDLAQQVLANPRRRGAADLYLRDHDGKSRAVARARGTVRRSDVGGLRSGEIAAARPVVALSRRVAAFRSNAADPRRRAERARRRRVLAFYGDHLPSFPRAFNYFGFHDLHSDYVIWPGRAGPAHCIDLPAHRLGSTVVDKVLGERGGRPAAVEAASQTVTPVPIAALGVD